MQKINKKIYPKILYIFAALIFLFDVFVFNSWQAESTLEKSIDQKTGIPLFEVEVIESQKQPHTFYTQSYGEVHAKTKLLLTSEVSGKIIEISEYFEVGTLVKKNDILLKIDDTQYRLALAKAESILSQAHVRLLEEERQAKQAQLEWELSGISDAPSSSLVLRKPQLQAAKSEYNEALVQIEKAKKDLESTQIKVHFDSLIISKNVVEGMIISQNTELGKLENIDLAEIELPLSSSQWKILPKDISKIDIQLFDNESEQEWQAIAVRREQHKDLKTRQSNLIATVKKPLEQGLLSGTFVMAKIGTKSEMHSGTNEKIKQANAMAIPSSSLFDSHNIWLVENGKLRKKAVNILHYDNEIAYIQAENDTVYSIVLRPSRRYSEGQEIIPIVVNLDLLGVE